MIRSSDGNECWKTHQPQLGDRAAKLAQAMATTWAPAPARRSADRYRYV